jgi:hypothetical protein
MNLNPEGAEFPQEDIVDRIAGALPENLRADFYREMRHCRSLPDNDEMLRILRIMQFLTLLIESAPMQIVVEREKLELLFATGLHTIKKMIDLSENYQRQLDQKIARLPETITDGIQTGTIVANINGCLRMEFARSTIPETAMALGVIAEQMKKATSEYAAAAKALGWSYQGAAEKAERAISDMNAAILRSAEASRMAAKKLAVNFDRTYWWLIFGLSGFTLVVGFVLGWLINP